MFPALKSLVLKKESFSTNQTIMKYIPDNGARQQSEREFFFNILSTIYPKEFSELIQAAYKARKLNNRTNEDNMIVMKDEIDKVLSYKSMS